MINGYDIAYGIGLGIAAPFWLVRPKARRKVFAAFGQRMGQVGLRDAQKPAVMIHAVSLGEMNATRSLVAMLQQARPELHFIISATTETGFARGQELYGSNPDITLIRYPLDFSGAVSRLLDAMRPSVVVLMELEVWPNFVKECQKRSIPVVLVNGRLTASSYQRYKLVKPVSASMFGRLARVCAQDELYAQRFTDLGVPPERVSVTGTMKFDTAQISDRVMGTVDLAAAVGLRPGSEPIWVCGSTGPGEEEIILRVYRQLLAKHSRLRLVIVPRKPERFNEVAQLIEDTKFEIVRRSKPHLRALRGPLNPVVLGDTMGELRKFYSMASIVFVGRTLVDLGPRQHGSDMIEPAALGKPVIVGPHTSNFAEAMNRFKSADAMMVVQDEAQLMQAVSVLLFTPEECKRMSNAALEVIRKEQGATQRHAQVILDQLKVTFHVTNV